ncbi:MAG: NAD(P)-dependent oxidoreductase [Candidatus Omnitrophota bacterium]
MKLNNRGRMRIVITGVSSFVGSHLAAFFSGRGHQVTGTISKNIKEYDPLHRSRLAAAQAAGTVLKRLDITDPEGAKRIVAAQRPEIWIHHAGYATDYGKADYNIAEGERVNVLPLDALYANISANECRGVIITGSSAEYSASTSPCREGDPCFPDTPYGLSKLTETLCARQLSLKFGIPTRVARLFIPYGAMDSANKVIPSVVASLKRGRPIDLSACGQKRDFTYIEDVVKGYSALMRDLARKSLFDIFNICSGQAVTLKKLLLYLAKQIKAEPSLLRFGAINMRSNEPRVSYGSIAKAQAVLNWTPRSLDEGLRAYLDDTLKGLS